MALSDVRIFFYKLCAVILIFLFCQLLYEVQQELANENEEARFKRGIDDKEIMLDLPGNLQNEHFVRNKRVNGSNAGSKQFVATDEWQEILPGQSVPAGLHYRVNLETGKKEAKLLDTSNKSKELLEIKNDDKSDSGYLNYDVQTDHQKTIDKLQSEFDRFKFDEKNTELNKDKDLKNWKTMDQIKKEFNDLNIKITTDSENVKDLLERYKKSGDDSDKIVILKDLEYILHQYDVASDFVKMNGLDILKADFLGNDNREIQSLISTVLGSASSSNPPFKVSLIKSGLFDKLIAKLDTQKDLKLNLKTIYAISSIVRQFPFAQKQLIEQNGLKIFKSKFFETSNGLNATDQIKIQTKIISLLSDLIDEHNFTAEELANLRKANATDQTSTELKNLEQKMKQYEQVNVEESFLKEGFCQILPGNLNNSSYDVKEKILKSMYSFRLTCKAIFKKDRLDNLLVIKQELLFKIEKDKQNGDLDDEYFQNLIQITQNLIDYLNS